MQQNLEPTVCVIGAGPCGITTAKNLLQQGLTHFTVFEKNAQLGGNWVFDEHNQHSSVYETTHIISSIWRSEFEDFPMPKSYPAYPSHRQLLAYFNDYAEHFKILPFIQFNTVVLKINQTAEKRWQVIYQNDLGEHEAMFDYLLIANGHHWDPVWPSYPGKFDGNVLHSHAYKRAAPFKDQRVLVVGAGNSACDIAVEVGRIASKSCISVRRGQHIFPKFLFGRPIDRAFAKIRWMPSWGKQLVIWFVLRVLQGRYPKFQLPTPAGRALKVHPTINSELIYFIAHGKVYPRPGIKCFEGHTVYFVDGSQEEFDTVIFATGYKISFPFFDKNFIDYSESVHIPLYRKMMHADHDNLFFIGLFQPQGCIWPLADYQAKLAAKIIKGAINRPENLSCKIQKELKKSRQQFKENTRHALEVDYDAFRRQLLKELKS